MNLDKPSDLKSYINVVLSAPASFPTLGTFTGVGSRRRLVRACAATLFCLAFNLAFGQHAVLDGLAAMRASDCKRAVKLLEPLERDGPPEAWKLLGDMYAFGHCKPVDRPRAARLYSGAAEQGYAPAQYNLAVAYDKGDGVAANLATAIDWYTKAASQGQADAQSNLAVLYFTGRGVERDDVKGADLTESAALKGYAPAQDNLGKVYREGIGRSKDLVKAESWHRKAAEQGHPPALANIGALYEMGWVVRMNHGLAYTHYLMAQRAGYKQADESMNRLRNGLSANQLAEAQRIARSWQPGASLPLTFPYQ
jgi:TPR repeat protein